MDTKPEIIMVDDEPQALSRIANLIAKYYTADTGVSPSLGPQAPNLHGFNSGSAALAYYAAVKRVDIVFLDIMMPALSGVETALRLREKEFRGYIIFLTSSNDFAAESYAVEAFCYLLKPVEPEIFFSLMRRLEAALERKGHGDEACVMIRTKQYNRNILFRELVFVEVMGHKLFIHLANKEIVSINKSLNTFAAPLLEDGRFAYCHHGSMVNMDYVKTIKHNVTVLKTGHVIPLSRRHHDFKSLFIARSIRRTEAPGHA
jgi:DNA-binding LytR/AlgR family response regulator